MRYVPSSTVAHEGPATLKDFLVRRAFYGTTAAPLSRRHGEAVAPLHLSGWSLAVWTLLLARRPVLALAALSASIVMLARRLRGLVRDPVGVATHIAGGGTARCGAAGARLVDAGLVARLRARAGSSAGPVAAAALALRRPRAARVGRRPAGRRPGARRRRPRGRRCRLRHRGLDRLRAGADAGAPHPSHRLARPRLVDASARATAAGAARAAGAAGADREADRTRATRIGRRHEPAPPCRSGQRRARCGKVHARRFARRRTGPAHRAQGPVGPRICEPEAEPCSSAAHGVEPFYGRGVLRVTRRQLLAEQPSTAATARRGPAPGTHRVLVNFTAKHARWLARSPHPTTRSASRLICASCCLSPELQSGSTSRSRSLPAHRRGHHTRPLLPPSPSSSLSPPPVTHGG